MSNSEGTPTSAFSVLFPYFIGEPRMWGIRPRYRFGGMAD